MNKETRKPTPKEAVPTGRTLLQVEDLAFYTFDKPLFYGLNFMVRAGESVAVTGKSGTGKSILLKIVTDREQPDKGGVKKSINTTIGYVPQKIETIGVEPGISVKDLFYKSRGLDELDRRQAELQAQLDNGDYDQDVAIEFTDVLEKYEQKGGYTAEADAQAILNGLGLSTDKERNINLDTNLDEVSSGQRTRLLIGQALFARPDLLVLDDPTSHLDVESVKWLATFLKQTKQGALIVSNDTDFLNMFANKVIEITDFGRGIVFEGNYAQFTAKRDELVGFELKEAELLKREIERLQETVERYRRWGNRSEDVARRRVVTERRVERMQEEYDNMPGAQIPKEQVVRPHPFEIDRRSGQDVVIIDGVTKSYGDFKAVDLSKVHITVRNGETLLVSGRNGSGKSTLFRMIASVNQGTFTPDAGRIAVGGSVDLGYYTPDLAVTVGDASLLEECKRALSISNDGKIRSILTYWGFSRNEIEYKTLDLLSKGEQTQLALAKLMLLKPNLLLLDEPTNNLSESVRDRLADSLKGFKGTLMLISHDPEFTRMLSVDRELVLPSGQIKLWK